MAMVIDPARVTFAVVATRDVASADGDAVMQTSFADGHDVVTSGPGFAGGAWLVQNPETPESEQAGTRRVLQCLLWETRVEANACQRESIRAPAPAGAVSAIETTVGELYRVGEVMSVDGLGRAVLDAHDPRTALVTGVISFQPAPGTHGWIDEYNRSETRDYIRHLPGFVSASFLCAEGDERLIEVVQWDSSDAFEAALRDERFREHVDVVNHYSSSEVGGYRVLATIDGAPRAVADSERPRCAPSSCSVPPGAPDQSSSIKP